MTFQAVRECLSNERKKEFYYESAVLVPAE